MPNQFWFSAYDRISLNKTIEDYHIDIATRFLNSMVRDNLIKTRQITTNNVPRTYIYQRQPILGQQQTTGEQRQNVHNSDIQDSFSKSVLNIMKSELPINKNYLSNMTYYYLFDGFNIFNNLRFITHVKNQCETQDIVSRCGVKYGEIFERIWTISEYHEHKTEIRKILREEITSGIQMCFTGRVTRLVNTLTGFIEDVHIGISENEQISNTVIMILRKYENDETVNIKEEVKKSIR